MNAQNAPLRTASETVDQVFLSPRVVDKTAFEEFAATLRGLIQDATDKAAALERTSARAAQVHGRVAEAGSLMESRVTAAAKALDAVEARSLEAQSVLARATELVSSARALEAHADQIVKERAASLESTVESLVARASAQVEAVESRLSRLTERLETLSLEGQRRADELAARVQGLLDAGAGAEESRVALGDATLLTVGTIEQSVATRDALRAEVAIVTERIRALQGELTGVVRETRETLTNARSIEVKPTRAGRKADTETPARTTARRKSARRA